jgi:FkbM family methyltransferase
MKIKCLVKVEDFLRKYRKLGDIYNKLDEFKAEMNALKWALADKHLGLLELRMNNAFVDNKYKQIFYNIKEESICFDCGMHIGLISDIFLQMGAVVHAFEPNRHLFEMLKYKYKNAENITLNNAAVSDQSGELDFYTTGSENGNYLAALQGSSVYSVEVLPQDCKYKVKAIDLCEYIREHIASQNKRIYILKLDIEGAEFDILPKLIETGMYKYADYIFVEEHARFFDNGDERLSNVKSLIKENNIKNIFLDWI